LVANVDLISPTMKMDALRWIYNVVLIRHIEW